MKVAQQTSHSSLTAGATRHNVAMTMVLTQARAEHDRQTQLFVGSRNAEPILQALHPPRISQLMNNEMCHASIRWE